VITMIDRHDFSARDRRNRERRIWRRGLFVSVLVHLSVFLGWQGSVIPARPDAVAGPRIGDGRVAAGGVQAVNLPNPQPRAITPPPRPISVDVEVEPVEFEHVEAFDPLAVLGEAPGLTAGPGVLDGGGEGDRGTADRDGDRLQPAQPRGMIIPPTDPGLRGTRLQVWVFVDEAGRVVPDSTRLEPPTRDRGFNRRLVREAAEWVFKPATRDGRTVSSWFPYRIIM
jgi:hypothetical protein